MYQLYSFYHRISTMVWKAAFPLVLVATCIQVGVNGNEYASSTIQEVDVNDMSNEMLQMLIQQNKKLAAQNEQLHKVWTALSSMCKTFETSTCNCEEPTDRPEPTFTPTMPPTKSVYLRPPSFPLSVKAITFIKGTGIPTVTVDFIGGHYHSSHWFCLYENDAQFRTVGKIFTVSAEDYLFSSTIQVQQFENLRKLIFRLYNDVERLSLDFNLTALTKTQSIITDFKTVIFDVMPSYTVPEKGDLNVTFTIDKRVAEENNIESTEAYFLGVNSSSLNVFEHSSYNSDHLKMNRTDFPNISVIAKRSIAENGGELMLTYDQISPTAMVQSLKYTLNVKVIPPEENYMLPYGKLGVYPLKEKTFILPPLTSVTCFAMGNPKPQVSILKVDEDGKTTDVEMERIEYGSYLNLKIHTLSPKQASKMEGTYVCSASNGIRTVNTTTQVIAHQLVFNDRETRVVQKGEFIVVTCKATGNPVPRLSYRLYDQYGPDLEPVVKYERRTDSKSERLRIKIPVSDADDYHTIICAANQEITGGTREIVVKPGVDSNWDFYNALLANRNNETFIG